MSTHSAIDWQCELIYCTHSARDTLSLQASPYNEEDDMCELHFATTSPKNNDTIYAVTIHYKSAPLVSVLFNDRERTTFDTTDALTLQLKRIDASITIGRYSVQKHKHRHTPNDVTTTVLFRTNATDLNSCLRQITKHAI